MVLFPLRSQIPTPAPPRCIIPLDGNDPSLSTPLFTGIPIPIDSTTVLNARAFSYTNLPSRQATATYFVGVEHITPVISLTTDNMNLYGSSGIFDNWWTDWKKTAYIEYFDSLRNTVFSQRAGIQIDGGWGGARSNPQHSMRVKLDDGVLGDGPVNYPIIPDKPARMKYSQFFLRNGSNQYLVFPYKDACEQRIMSTLTGNHYASWRPVTVYLNGDYFGLYEFREKYDAEYFETLEGADPGEVDIISMTAWNNYVLRPVEGSLEPFFNAWDAFLQLDPADTAYWDSADIHFDMSSYVDYIIGESWTANTDWPWNNIKLYRSDKSGYRWRFCLTDLELSLQPNGWTDCFFDAIDYMMTYDSTNQFIYIWQKSMRNEKFRNYFINRYADVMNSGYLPENTLAFENDMFARTVPEMQNEYARWGDPNNIQGQILDFHQNHQIFQSQLMQRTTQVRNHLENNLFLPNQVSVTLDVDPPDAGRIKISTLEPGSYPWQGVYFNGIPIKIEADPEEGYNFGYWENNGLIADTLNTVFLDTLKASQVHFTAHFDEWAVPVPVKDNPAGFSVYPNPAFNFLFIRNNGEATSLSDYQVVNVNGLTVLEGILPAARNAMQINVMSLPAGVYVIVLKESTGQKQMIRFIKLK